MKIEDSPFRFGGTSPVEKLRRNIGPMEAMLDDLDLSFLDLLTTAATENPAGRTEAPITEELRKKAEPEPASESAREGGRPKLTLVGKISTAQPQDDPRMEVAEDMALLNTELTDIDVQYMKQVVIPGLPILIGSVPMNTIFPTEPDGSISYRGHDISPSLAELIEKGYKTGRPVRVEVDNRSAVVLRIRDGQVSAEFVSSDRGMALAMQQGLDDLHRRMSEKNLPVGTLDAKYQDPRQQREQHEEQDDTEEQY